MGLIFSDSTCWNSSVPINCCHYNAVAIIKTQNLQWRTTESIYYLYIQIWGQLGLGWASSHAWELASVWYRMASPGTSKVIWFCSTCLSSTSRLFWVCPLLMAELYEWGSRNTQAPKALTWTNTFCFTGPIKIGGLEEYTFPLWEELQSHMGKGWDRGRGGEVGHFCKLYICY